MKGFNLKLIFFYTSVSITFALQGSEWMPTCAKSSDITLISNPTDCRKYFVCFKGIAHPLACPFGLKWNPTLKKCYTTSNCESGKIYNPNCPNDRSPNNPTFLPDNKDCGKFYECHGQFSIHKNCPDQKHWSVEYQECTDASVAKCGILQNPFISGQLNPACPSNNDPKKTIHLPHPTDCTKFLKCSFGRSFVVSCPKELHWNIAADRCDSPFNAQCEKREESSVGTSMVPIVKPNSYDTPECPKAGVQNFGISGQCDKYYSCSQGKLYIITCRRGRHWNAEANGCIDSARAGCTGSS